MFSHWKHQISGHCQHNSLLWEFLPFGFPWSEAGVFEGREQGEGGTAVAQISEGLQIAVINNSYSFQVVF